MSKLEELIEQYCPDGVEWKTLKVVLKIRNGRDYKHLGEGPIPVYGSGGIMTYVDTPMYTNPSVLIPRKGSIDKLYYVDTPFWNVDTVFYTEIDTAQVVEKYVYYVLQKEHLEKLNTAGGVPSLTQSVLNEVIIPVPPLPVQEEIVRILDTFTKLQAELQAELQKRKQQYSYYLDNLLKFNNINRGGYQAEVRWMKMSDVFEIRNGYTPSKAKKEFWEGGTIPWFRMEDIRQNGRILSDSILHITPKGVKGKGLFKANSFILATTATIGEHALIIADSLANQQFTNLSIRKSLENELSVKYVYYYFFVIDEWCKANTNVSNFASVDMSKFYNLLIPIPSIAEQQRIVAILDRFDRLTNDLTSGLPAEIEKRRQQYEYYRDKLLTFKRKGA